MRRIILVAPVRTGVYSGDRYKNIEILNPDDQFVDRDTQQSLFISPKRDIMPVEGLREIENITFYLESVVHFQQNCEDFIGVITVAFHEFKDRKDVVELEGATFSLMQKIIFELGEDHELKLGSPLWVNRTLISYDKDDSALDNWLQDNTSSDFVPIGDGSVEIIAGWGNNALLLPSGGDIPAQAWVGLVLAQFVWTYAIDIEKYSLEILQEVQHVQPSKQGDLLKALVDLHYELAVQSIFHERLEVEADPLSRSISKSLLAAWSYNKVLQNIEARIMRLEHILTARSELLRRSSSVKMERILFAVTMSTIVSLVLSFIQTSFSGAVGVAPSGTTMDFLRQARLDWIFLISLVLTMTLSYLVLRQSGKVRNPLED